MNPTQLRWIYNAHNFKYCADKAPAKYKTWTQVKRLKEWPPCTNACFMWWEETDTFIVGANYDDATVEPLREWRQKYSMNKIAYSSRRAPEDGWHYQDTNVNYAAWQDMYYNMGMRQSEIARALGVSSAYCSNMKRKYEWDNFQTTE